MSYNNDILEKLNAEISKLSVIEKFLYFIKVYQIYIKCVENKNFLIKKVRIYHPITWVVLILLLFYGIFITTIRSIIGCLKSIKEYLRIYKNEI